jgi:hypothetical protein
MTKAVDDLTQHHIRPRRGCGKLAGGMDPSPPGFVRVHLTCRACGEAETLDLQTHAMMRCAACLSSTSRSRRRASRSPPARGDVPLIETRWRCGNCGSRLTDSVPVGSGSSP